MEYQVIVEQQDGIFRALIPTLPNLAAEGRSSPEAIYKLQQAVEEYLQKIEVTTIEVEVRPRQARKYSTAQDWLESAGQHAIDEDEMRQHLEEIYAERRRQREEVERELDAEAAAASKR